MTSGPADYLIVYWEVLLLAFVFTAILFFNVHREMGNNWQVTIFKAFLCTLMLALVVDGITHAQYRGFLHLPPLPIAFLYALYMFLFSGVLPLLWFTFAELRIGGRLLSKRSTVIIFLIPAAIISFMCFASIKTGWFFHVDENGIYTRGSLWAIQTAVSYIYFLFTTAHALIVAVREPSPLQRKQYYILSMYLIAPFLGGLLQLIVGNHPFVAPATSIAMMFIFLSIQSNMINNDTLTGLYNRKATERYIEDLKLRTSHKNPFYLYVMDVDGFKNINDSFGHMEGDRALRIVANVLHKVSDEFGGFVSRLGGDEFLAAIEAKNIDKPESFEERFREVMEKEEKILDLPYKLRLSFGYTKCVSPAVKLDDIINFADQKMYHKKTKRYSENSDNA